MWVKRSTPRHRVWVKRDTPRQNETLLASKAMDEHRTEKILTRGVVQGRRLKESRHKDDEQHAKFKVGQGQVKQKRICTCTFLSITLSPYSMFMIVNIDDKCMMHFSFIQLSPYSIPFKLILMCMIHLNNYLNV